jgi:HK97 family phage major capsid protein
MSNETNEVLEKAAATGSIVSGGIGGVSNPSADQLGPAGTAASNGAGILNPEQSRQFIEYIFEQQVLALDGRRVTMRANTAELEKLNVGERLIRAANQADSSYTNAGVTFTKVSITTSKIRLDWEVSTEALEDNIEGALLEDHLVRTMTRAFANDLEDLAINGDTAATGSASAFLNILNGFFKLETTSSGVNDAGGYNSGSTIKVEDLQDLILAMPRKYRASRSGMKFYTGSEKMSELLNTLANTGNFNSERIVERIVDGTVPQIVGAPFQYRVLGLPILEVPLFPDDYVSLTFPENRIWGFQRDVTVHREFQPKKDTVEYTVFLRFGAQIEEGAAVAFKTL